MDFRLYGLFFMFASVEENYRFDGEVIMSFESDFYIVFTLQYGLRDDGEYFKIFIELLSQILGKGGHILKSDVLIVVDLLDYLFYPKRLELVLFCEGLEVIWIEDGLFHSNVMY